VTDAGKIHARNTDRCAAVTFDRNGRSRSAKYAGALSSWRIGAAPSCKRKKKPPSKTVVDREALTR